MGFLERFRPQPKWKHPDPLIRVVGIQELDEQDGEILASLARQDADPRVRKAAIKRSGDPSVLAGALASDDEESVREEAGSRLLALAIDGPDEELAREALSGISEQRHLALVAKSSAYETVARSALRRLTDNRLMASVARQGRHESLRMDSVALLQDAVELSAIALKSEHKEVALAAVEKVAGEANLRGIAERARTKAAARSARAKLQAMAEKAVAETAVVGHYRDTGVPLSAAVAPGTGMAASRREICERLERFAQRGELAGAEEMLANADRAWFELEADGTDEQATARFAAARQALVDAIEADKTARAAKEALESEVARAVEARVALCERVQAFVRTPAEALAIDTESHQVAVEEPVEGGSWVSFGDAEIDAARRFLESIRAEWSALPPPPAGGETQLNALGERFETACAAALRHMEEWEANCQRRERLEAIAKDAEALVASPDFPGIRETRLRWSGLQREWSALSAAVTGLSREAVEAYERASSELLAREQRAREERAKEQQENVARLERLCGQAEAAVGSQSLTLKNAERLARDLRTAIEQPRILPGSDRPRIIERLKTAHTTLQPRIRELRELDEWQRWANATVQEELCAQMEALRTVDDAAEATTLARQLQDRWKQAAAAPPQVAGALWSRFREAREAVRARWEAHLIEQAKERAENLKRKETLCEAVEALAESTDWVRTAETIKAKQAEWKTIGPVPKGFEKTLWERFRRACDQFFTRRQQDLSRRKEEWAANLARKEALCQRAEAFSVSTEWESAAAEIRRLQAEWRTVGPVRKNRSDAIWQRFRAACDLFYQRYQRRDELTTSARIEERGLICSELEALAADPTERSPHDLAEAVKALAARWQEAVPLNLLPREQSSSLKTRFAEALDRITAAVPEPFRGSSLDMRSNRARMEQLVARVESLLASRAPEPETEQSPAEVLARKLREALAANTIGGRPDDEARWRVMAEEVQSTQAEWQRVGPVPESARLALTSRFETACGKIMAQRPRPSPTQSLADGTQPGRHRENRRR
jgi:hypothetical protein